MPQDGPPQEVRVLQKPSSLYHWLRPWNNPNTHTACAHRMQYSLREQTPDGFIPMQPCRDSTCNNPRSALPWGDVGHVADHHQGIASSIRLADL